MGSIFRLANQSHNKPIKGLKIITNNELELLFTMFGSIVKNNKGSMEDRENEFIVKRFDHLLKKQKKLEKQARTGEDEKIHKLRLNGKIISYNMIFYKELLQPERLKEADRLKKLHDVTGKLHDLEEIRLVTNKIRKNRGNRKYLVQMLRFYEGEKEKYFIKFLKLLEN